LERPRSDAGTAAGGAVFVTGGTGLLGAPIVRRLTEEGRRVRALARSHASHRALERLGAEPSPGDVLDDGALVAGMDGCDVVYHLAGINAFCLRDPAVMFAVNVTGSRRIVAAAARAGVRRIVYTSSAAAIGERAGERANEDSEHRGWFLSDYERSKWQAENEVGAMASELGVDVVTVSPSSVQGPGRAGGTGRFLRMYLNGRLPVFVESDLSLVDIADCTEGHLLAARDGAPGRRYLLSGATLKTSSALGIVAGLTGIEDRPRLLPARVALAAGAIAGGAARVLHRDAPMCSEIVRTLVHGHSYDGSRASRELGLGYTPIEQTLERTIAWLVRRGLVTRPLPAFSMPAEA
jgi:dihydroflavonol-4-reductase